MARLFFLIALILFHLFPTGSFFYLTEHAHRIQRRINKNRQHGNNNTLWSIKACSNSVPLWGNPCHRDIFCRWARERWANQIPGHWSDRYRDCPLQQQQCDTLFCPKDDYMYVFIQKVNKKIIMYSHQSPSSKMQLISCSINPVFLLPDLHSTRFWSRKSANWTPQRAPDHASWLKQSFSPSWQHKAADLWWRVPRHCLKSKTRGLAPLFLWQRWRRTEPLGCKLIIVVMDGRWLEC